MLLWWVLACGRVTSPMETGVEDSQAETGDSGGDGICSPDHSLTSTQTRTSTAIVQGEEAGAGLAFLAIPFTEPPLGALRLAPPQPYACRDGEVISAQTFGPTCPQLDDEGALTGSEDCLQLNVFTPDTALSGARPVMVFIHGGGMVQGSASREENGVALFDGALLAERTGAIVVTLQYRLGALGFLNHPELRAAGLGGNLGTQDQLQGLAWVQENAAAFGGDPAQVMVFGESAGALSICGLYTSPYAEGLFSAAVIQSGGCQTATLAEAEAEGEAYAAELGCEDAACLQEAPLEDLVALSTAPISELGVPGTGGFGLSIDGDVLPQDPWDALAAGEHVGVPLIVGHNREETGSYSPTLSEAEYETLLKGLFLTRWEEAAALWSVEEYGSARSAWIALSTDASFGCPAQRMADLVSANGTPAYRYLFTHTPDTALSRVRGAYHGLELLYLFQRLEPMEAAGLYEGNTDDEAVEALMRTLWLAHAQGEDLQADGVAWPVTDDTQPYLELAAEPAVGTGWHAEQCGFLGEVF